MNAFTTLRYYAAVFLLLPLAVGTAVAAPATDNPPPTKHKPGVATKPRAADPADAGSKKAASVAAAPTAPAASPAPAVAPQTVQLKGIVLMPDGRPCAGASVYPAGAPRQLTVTNAQGAFTLPVPAGKAVSLRVEYFGEGSSRVEVPTPSSELLHITLGN